MRKDLCVRNQSPWIKIVDPMRSWLCFFSSLRYFCPFVLFRKIIIFKVIHFIRWLHSMANKLWMWGVRCYEMANFSIRRVWVYLFVEFLYGKEVIHLAFCINGAISRPLIGNRCFAFSGLPFQQKKLVRKNLVHFWWAQTAIDFEYFDIYNVTSAFDDKSFFSRSLHIYRVPIYLGNWVIVNVRKCL